MAKPVIALTMGDAAGIGPEIVIEVLTRKTTRERCNPLVIGAPRVFTAACARLLGSRWESGSCAGWL